MQDVVGIETDCYKFDQTRDIIWSRQASGFEHALHIFDTDWHGIRNAASYAPGCKFSISHKLKPGPELIRYLTGMIFKHDIRQIIFQGYSESAHTVAEQLARERPNGVRLLAVVHVTAAQFDHQFEPRMLGLIRRHRQDGILDKAASVKPEFHRVAPFCEDLLIYNFPPQVTGLLVPTIAERDNSTVFVPVEKTFRKNLYTNIIAALECGAVRMAYSVNEPIGLDSVRDVGRVKVVGFQRRAELFAWMARVACVLNVSFAECQPMTNLEALACGTPCLTGQLNLPDIRELELSRLSEVAIQDEPTSLVGRLETLIEMQTGAPEKLLALIDEYLDLQSELAARSYNRLLHGGG